MRVANDARREYGIGANNIAAGHDLQAAGKGAIKKGRADIVRKKVVAGVTGRAVVVAGARVAKEVHRYCTGRGRCRTRRTVGPVFVSEQLGSSVKFIVTTVGVPSALNFTLLKMCELPTMLVVSME